MIIGIRHIPSSVKRAIETIGEHNMLHELSHYCDIKDDVKEESNEYQNNFGPQPAAIDVKDDIKDVIIRRHKSAHQYLLEYPEYADDFYEGSLDDTLDPSMKAAYMMAKAKARRAEQDERDVEEMVEKGHGILEKLVAYHKNVDEDKKEGD